MKIIIGETGWTRLEWNSYRGVIGLFYNSTLEGVLAYAIFAIIAVLCVIGLVTVVKWLTAERQPDEPEDPHKKWMRTGHT